METGRKVQSTNERGSDSNKVPRNETCARISESILDGAWGKKVGMTRAEEETERGRGEGRGKGREGPQVRVIVHLGPLGGVDQFVSPFPLSLPLLYCTSSLYSREVYSLIRFSYSIHIIHLSIYIYHSLIPVFSPSSPSPPYKPSQRSTIPSSPTNQNSRSRHFSIPSDHQLVGLSSPPWTARRTLL